MFGDVLDPRSARWPAWLAAGRALKVVAGCLALALGRLPADARRHSRVLVLNGVASAILCVWGGANVVVGALVLSGAIAPSADVDRRVLHWHVFVWDMWFVVWGVALALAVAAARRQPDRLPGR